MHRNMIWLASGFGSIARNIEAEIHVHVAIAKGFEKNGQAYLAGQIEECRSGLGRCRTLVDRG